MTTYDTLIDGGYLSWVHGTRPQNFGGWPLARFKYQESLILLDSPILWRTGYYPLYKSRRKARRVDDPQKLAMHAKVMRFRTVLKEDPIMKTLETVGTEADDLLALAWLKGHGRRAVLAEDKDLCQVPGLMSRMRDFWGEPIVSHLHLPKYLREPETPGEYVLLQALLGDRSDSIPRLLPSLPRESIFLSRVIWASRSPLMTALGFYGAEMVRNLNLVLIPGPFLRRDSAILAAEPYYLASLVEQGTYWDPESFVDLPEPQRFEEPWDEARAEGLIEELMGPDGSDYVDPRDLIGLESEDMDE